MKIFSLGIATEHNDYKEEIEDQVWIKLDNGILVLMEDNSNESN